MLISAAYKIKKGFVFGLIFAAAFMFISCENFMRGSNTRAELERLLEEANAPEVEIYIACDTKYGVVAPNGYVRHKKGQSFTLVFIENPGYKFIRWQVVDKDTLQPVTDAISFDDSTAKETKVKLLRTAQNLYISPVCAQLPRVESFYPSEIDSGVYANTPIRIKFNMPVNLPTKQQLVQVMQTYPLKDGEYTDITEYYNAPVLSDDGTTIQLIPQSQRLADYIEKQNHEKLIRVSVSLNPEINAIVGGVACYRYVENSTDNAFAFRLNNHIEDQPPEERQFFATRTSLTLSDVEAKDVIDTSSLALIPLGLLNDLQNVQAQSVYDRMTGEYLYLYGEYKDADSGFDTIIIEEKLTNTKEGIPVTDRDWLKGDVSSIQKWETPAGSTRFLLKYKIKSEDGAINFKITPVDYCGNAASEKNFTIFKSTRIGLENVEPFNWLGAEQSEENLYTWCLIDDELADISVNSIPKTVRIAYECKSNTENEVAVYKKYLRGHELKELLFGDIYLQPDDYSVSYKIDGNEYVQFDYHEEAEEFDSIGVASWISTFDVDSVEGLTFTVLVEDALGNKEENNYEFPGAAEINCANYEMDPPLFYVSSDYDFDGLLVIDTVNWKHEQFEGNYFTDLFNLVVCKNKNLIGPLQYFTLDDLIPEEIIDSNITIQSIQFESTGEKTGTHRIFVNLNSNAWYINSNDFYDELFIRYSTSYKNGDDSELAIWNIKEFEKNSTTCSFCVNTEELYENGLNVAVWGKKGNVISEEVNYKDSYFLYHSSSLKDNAAPVFYDVERTLENLEFIFSAVGDSSGYNYEEYMIHPEIKEFMSGLDYIEWWSDEYPQIKYSAGVECDWKEFIIPNWDMDLPKGNIHISAVDKKNNKSECVLPYTFYYNYFDFKVMGTSGDDRRKFCMPNEIKRCRDFVLIISTEDTAVQNICKIAYKINESESNYFSIKPYSTDYVINLTDSKMCQKIDECDEETEDFYLNIQDKLVKFTYTASIPNCPDLYDSDNFGVSNAVYCYCGDLDEDFFSKIVFLENGAMLSSNYPAIVYTLVTKHSYEECKSWDINKWDRRRKQIGKEYFDFGSTTSDIYESPLDQIAPGECYIMVAHFSDGSVKYSSVRQK